MTMTDRKNVNRFVEKKSLEKEKKRSGIFFPGRVYSFGVSHAYAKNKNSIKKRKFPNFEKQHLSIHV